MLGNVIRIQALVGQGAQWEVNRTGDNLHLAILEDGCGGDETEPLDFDLTLHTQASIIAAISASSEYAAVKLAGFDATPAADLDWSGWACPAPMDQGTDAFITGPI